MNKNGIFNIPNVLSITRIFLALVIAFIFILGPGIYDVIPTVFSINSKFFLPLTYLICFLLFIIASFTDWLDGYIARKYNQVTTFGKFVDSIADKILINTVLILFACDKIIPIWIAIILLVRDLIIDTMKGILGSKGIVVGANKWGRIRAFCLMVFLTFYFLINIHTIRTIDGWYTQTLYLPIYFCTVLSIVSAAIYLKTYWPQLTTNEHAK